ncbi:MAG: hypothetical protein J3K34DRAFT_524532 [Monoraphidium minutum]|nr:MAG: hypothetical protein J3K34DRAFT_524532 [Monoraphidium minutum]
MDASQVQQGAVGLQKWWKGLPVVTKSVSALLAGVYLSQLPVPGAWRGVCLSPLLVVQRLQVWRLVTGHLLHAGLLHLALNLAAFMPLSAGLERAMGSVRYAHMLAVLVALQDVVHIGLAYAARALGFRRALRACAIGCSGAVFALIAVDCAASGPAPRRLFGAAEVPGPLVPWALILLIQVLVPGASFLGHVAGLLAGEAWAGGLLPGLSLSDAAVARAEAHPAYEAHLPRLGAPVAGAPGAAPVGDGGSSSSLVAAWALSRRAAAAAWARLPPPTRERALDAWARARLALLQGSTRAVAALPPQATAAAAAASAALAPLLQPLAAWWAARCADHLSDDGGDEEAPGGAADEVRALLEAHGGGGGSGGGALEEGAAAPPFAGSSGGSDGRPSEPDALK